MELAGWLRWCSGRFAGGSFGWRLYRSCAGASGRVLAQVLTGDRTFHSASLRCSWFSRALLGRSEPCGAYRRQRRFVLGFRSPRADPRGMKTSRCARGVSVPRVSDDASSLENGAFMELVFGALSMRRSDTHRLEPTRHKYPRSMLQEGTVFCQ